ncbi:MAG: hypothetical protein SOZ59_14765 [Candidatus Limivivens sp.]|nr:hypothetical protein [Candidatus Limivivens sp.]
MKANLMRETVKRSGAKAMGCLILSAAFFLGTAGDSACAVADVQAIEEEILALDIHSREDAKQLVPLYTRYCALTAEEKEEVSGEARQLLESATEIAGSYNHSDQGVSVSGNIPWYVQLEVSVLENAPETEEDLEILIPYEITLLDLYTNSEYTLPEGELAVVSVPAPETEEEVGWKVLHYLKDGSIEELEAEVSGGMVSFRTNSFSTFGLAGQTIIGIGPGSGTNFQPDEEQTDSSESAGTEPGGSEAGTSGGVVPSGGNTSSAGSSVSTDSTVATDPALTGDPTDIWSLAVAALGALLVIGAILCTGSRRRER